MFNFVYSLFYTLWVMHEWVGGVFISKAESVRMGNHATSENLLMIQHR